MLTCRYPHTTGVINNNIRIPETEVTIAKVLKETGYRTGYIGKWHLDGEDKPGFVPPGARRQGFDYWAGFNRGHRYDDSIYFRDTESPIHEKRYEPDYQTDLALDFIRTNNEHPFCLFLSWGPPHTPLIPPEPYGGMYRQEDVILRPNVPDKVKEQAADEIARYN
jgi:arylsulfatase A-like enzyme